MFDAALRGSEDPIQWDSSRPFGSRRSTIRSTVIWSAALALVAMPVFSFHAVGRPTWQSALHLLATRGAHFGPEVVFTYGPLGFLGFPQLYYPVSGLLAAATLVLVVSAIALVTVVALRRSLAPAAFMAVAYGSLVLGWGPLLAEGWLPEVVACLTAVAALSIISQHLDGRRPVVRVEVTAIVLGGVAALLVLMKLSSGLQASLVACATIWAISKSPAGGWRSSVRGLAIWLAAFLTTSVLGWVMAGQRLGDMPSYLGSASEIVTGYSSAMGVEGPSRWEYLAALTLVLGFAGLIYQRWGGDNIRRQPVVLVTPAVFVFAAFKHGFVRHDDEHAVVFFLTVGLIALFVAGSRAIGPALVVFGFSLAVVWGPSPAAAAATLNPLSHLKQSGVIASVFVDSAHRAAVIGEIEAEGRQFYGLSTETIEVLRGHSVHIGFWETMILWAYPEFDWGAPPVFQTYSAYTKHLDELNAAAVRSESGPEFILTEADAIDGRHPAWESPAYMLEVACRYQEVKVERSFSVLQRRDSVCDGVTSMGRSTVRFGEAVLLPDDAHCEGWVVLTVDGLDSFGQSLQSTLFKDAEYLLKISGAGTFRLVPGTAGQPHLLPDWRSPAWLGPPLLSSGADLRIEKQWFGPFSPTAVEIEFGCVAVRPPG